MSLVGAAVRRKEDPSLLTGRGRFVDDLAPRGAAFAQSVRSTEAHALVRSVDTSAAGTNVVAAVPEHAEPPPGLLAAPRTEAMLTMSHSRAQVSEVSFGFDDDGCVHALRLHTIQEQGAYPDGTAMGPGVLTSWMARCAAATWSAPSC